MHTSRFIVVSALATAIRRQAGGKLRAEGTPTLPKAHCVHVPPHAALCISALAAFSIGKPVSNHREAQQLVWLDVRSDR